jgi:hypothetical protein
MESNPRAITIIEEQFSKAVTDEMMSIVHNPEFANKAQGAFLFAMGGAIFAHNVGRRLFDTNNDETEQEEK